MSYSWMKKDDNKRGWKGCNLNGLLNGLCISISWVKLEDKLNTQADFIIIPCQNYKYQHKLT